MIENLSCRLQLDCTRLAIRPSTPAIIALQSFVDILPLESQTKVKCTLVSGLPVEAIYSVIYRLLAFRTQICCSQGARASCIVYSRVTTLFQFRFDWSNASRFPFHELICYSSAAISKSSFFLSSSCYFTLFLRASILIFIDSNSTEMSFYSF